MPLYFVVFIFFMIHIQFLVRKLILGTDRVDFFYFSNVYPFTNEIAVRSLVYVLLCVFAFFLGFIFFRRNNIRNDFVYEPYDAGVIKRIRAISTALLMSHAILTIYIILVSDGSYGSITQIRKSFSFLYELRMIPLVMVCFIILNVKPSVLLRYKKNYFFIFSILLYLAASWFIQARSIIFEILVCFAFAYFRWYGDRFRFRYFVYVFIILMIPNIMVMSRLDLERYSFFELMVGLFSFEYSVIFNNILAASFLRTEDFAWGVTFIPNLSLIIPSPIRDYFGIDYVNLDLYRSVAQFGGVYGGGFSMLGELYINFGWLGAFFMFSFGCIYGRLTGKVMNNIKVSLLLSGTPLYYSAFVLAVRNDLGIYFKYCVQLLVVTLILGMIFRSKNTARTEC
ncbi:O-antigen polymerase [Marinobacterium zhoushanense]|uniref:O-antigen polymerase n=1 Tax=Marinobacterium zhoushanense TaxID=1679163 RepID=UPI00166AB33B|nr:O-antigen polymerase [Marinobacterium zhoushanense]